MNLQAYLLEEVRSVRRVRSDSDSAMLSAYLSKLHNAIMWIDRFQALIYVNKNFVKLINKILFDFAHCAFHL